MKKRTLDTVTQVLKKMFFMSIAKERIKDNLRFIHDHSAGKMMEFFCVQTKFSHALLSLTPLVEKQEHQKITGVV